MAAEQSMACWPGARAECSTKGERACDMWVVLVLLLKRGSSHSRAGEVTRGEAHATGFVGHERHIVQGCDGPFVHEQGARRLAFGAVVVAKRGVAKHDLRLAFGIDGASLHARGETRSSVFERLPLRVWGD